MLFLFAVICSHTFYMGIFFPVLTNQPHKYFCYCEKCIPFILDKNPNTKYWFYKSQLIWPYYNYTDALIWIICQNFKFTFTHSPLKETKHSIPALITTSVSTRHHFLTTLWTVLFLAMLAVKSIRHYASQEWNPNGSSYSCWL
jgi:hypothetical protein